MECPECSRGEFRRTTRKGFLEKSIYSLFGYYPWKCPVCRFRTLLKSRGERLTDRDPSAPPAALDTPYQGPERRARRIRAGTPGSATEDKRTQPTDSNLHPGNS